MNVCQICGKNPDNYNCTRPFQCSSCTNEIVNYIRMLERETKIDIKNKDYFLLAQNTYNDKRQRKEAHKKLRQIRKEKGWSVKALAEYLKVKSSYLSMMESGIKPLTKSALSLIERFDSTGENEKRIVNHSPLKIG